MYTFNYVHKMNICTFHFELLLDTKIICRLHTRHLAQCPYCVPVALTLFAINYACTVSRDKQAQSQAGQREAKSKLTHLLPSLCNSSSTFPTPSFYENQKPLVSCTSCFDGEEKLSKKKNKLPHIRISCVVRAP